MSDNLEEELERWLTKTPPDLTPVEFAAVIFSCQRQIEAEDWTQDEHQEIGKESVLHTLRYMSTSAIFLENHNKTGSIFSDEVCDEYRRSNLLSPSEAIQRFNVDTNLPSILEDEQHPLYNDAHLYIDALNYEVDKNRDFYDVAREIADNNSFGLDDLEPTITGTLGVMQDRYPAFLSQSVRYSNSMLLGLLNTREHPYALNRLRSKLTPDDGPKDAYSAYLLSESIMADFWRRRESGEHSLSVYEHRAYEKLHILMGCIAAQLSDLPKEKIRNELSDEQRLVPFRKTHHLDTEAALGLLRFYVAHSKEKMEAKENDVMSECLEGALDDLLKISSLNPSLSSGAVVEKSEFCVSYEKPTPEELAKQIKGFIESKYSEKRSKGLVQAFDDTRSNIPDGMEEAVVYYYPEPQTIRDWRKTNFRRGDGPRSAFLKSVAQNYAGELEDRGFSEEAIEEMKKTGKIPENEHGEERGLTVEHINDREYGGSNHEHNFILMPGSINEQKDFLRKGN